MTKTRLQFNIHGLILQATANHSLLSQMLTDDLGVFQTKENAAQDAIKVILETLPSPENRNSLKNDETSQSFIKTPDALVKRYGKNMVTVNFHLKKRYIRPTIAPEPYLFPDPAYHLCLTQPLNVWFKEKGLFFLHAGCVAEKGRGILLVGHSQAGKSTLTLSAIRSGFKFFGDEQPILSIQNGQIQVRPFPRRIRIDRKGAIIFPELRSLLKTSVAERLTFHAQDIWPKCIGSSCSPKLLIFPRFETKNRISLSKLHPTDALDRLLQDDHFIWYKNKPWNRLSHQHLALFQQLVNTTKSFELTYSERDILQIPVLFRKLLHE